MGVLVGRMLGPSQQTQQQLIVTIRYSTFKPISKSPRIIIRKPMRFSSSTGIRKKLKHLLPAHIRVIDKFSVRAPHFIYYPKTLEEVRETHKPPMTWQDRLAKKSIVWIRFFFDKMTGYDEKRMTENKWTTRCIFLETVAGVPGMVGGMGRHLRSLRFLEQDKGRIHHLLEEADN